MSEIIPPKCKMSGGGKKKLKWAVRFWSKAAGGEAERGEALRRMSAGLQELSDGA